MPMSPQAQAAALASSSKMVLSQLLVFEHETISPLRFVNSKEPFVKDGFTYNPFGFRIRPPIKSSERVPTINIEVGIVDYRVILALLELRGYSDVYITYIEVEYNAPDNELFRARFEYDDMQTNGTTAATIKATFLAGALDQSYPKGRFGPSNVA